MNDWYNTRKLLSMEGLRLFQLVILLCTVAIYSFSLPQSKEQIISIQPLGNIPPSYVTYVYTHLKEILPGIVINDTKPLPPSAYYPARNRYRADSLIDILSRATPARNVTIGLTTVDISCTSDSYPDWGVFGLSYMPGKACIASSYRSKVNKAEGLFFTAIHELGHCMGLDHCTVPSCLMNDAKGHTIDAETFCPKCKAYLQAKGWTL